MSGLIALASHLVLVCVFAWAAVAKIARPGRWRSALARYRLGPSLERIAAYGVPAAEGGVVALLLWGDPRAGAAFALALVSAFSLVVLRARALSGDRVPCGCFGAASTRDYREMLGRNALLAAGAGTLLFAEGRASWVAPDGNEVVAVTLTAVGALLVTWLVRQATLSLKRRP